MAAFKEKQLGGIASFVKTKSNYLIRYLSGESATLTILNNHVFRYYMSPTGQFLDYPRPINATDVAKINSKAVEDYSKLAFTHSVLEQSEHVFIVQTNKLQILFNKISGMLEVIDKIIDQSVLKEHKSIQWSDSSCKQTLNQSPNEYFFGGGMHNGRFTHKGERLEIVNPSCWVDGCSSIPLYWSTNGYGVLRNTWQTGHYDFGSKDKQIIVTDHEEDHFDAFYFINPIPKDIFKDYYELTGRPGLMPEYAFYEAHINTYNTNYWYESGPSNLSMHCEDDRYYEPYKMSSIHGRNGILGSLNGEKTKYEFSARFMIDWYKSQDMPLGWFVPNDESGYGQTDSLVGDLENLKAFVEYANAKGVQVALWTDGCLEPKDLEHPEKGERDLSREVKVGVVALKCTGDCPFNLDALDNASKLFMNIKQNNVRPFIIVNDGWAGTQRYASICSGYQTGGMWEHIRLHITALIGAGLSGLPIIGSDMDGTYGGGDIEVNIREFQWKIFTPIQLNTEGWGRMEKMPFSFNCIESIALNRAALKLKSMLLPYNYTICYESIQGLPMIRAMLLEFPKETASYTKDSQYQFMWGPSILVAPIYENADPNCRPVFVNSSSFYWGSNEFVYRNPKTDNVPVRNGVYLPVAGQVWIDLHTGERYQGGKIYNNIKTPIWKIPVFVKDGAIIPLVNANNNPNEVDRTCRIFLIYPNGETRFEVYEDDGKSSQYLEQKCAKTTISVKGPASNERGNISIYLHKTRGNYRGMVRERSTVLKIMASENVESIKAVINENIFNIQAVKTKEEFEKYNNVYYFDQKFIINPHLEPEFRTVDLYQKLLHVDIQKTDVTDSEIRIEIKGFSNKGEVFGSNFTVIESLEAPKHLTAIDQDITAKSITLRWEDNDASFYEIERDGNTIFSYIIGCKFTFKIFNYESKHSFRIRSVKDSDVSEWSNSIVVETKINPIELADDVVKNITVSCNKPSEFQLDVSNLTKIDNSWWHTEWSWRCEWDEMEKILLSFDLNDVFELRKIEYLPREDAGNGTFLKVQYRHSMDGENWTTMSPTITWGCDDSTKIIHMNGAKFKHFELEVLDAVLGHGSGRSIIFYKM